MSALPERKALEVFEQDGSKKFSVVSDNAGDLAAGEVITIFSPPELTEEIEKDEEGQNISAVIERQLSDNLTGREKEMLILVAQGYSSNEIAENFNLASRTVTAYLPRIYNKIGAKNKEEAVEWTRKTILGEEVVETMEVDALSPLTPKERERLPYLAKGLSDAQIGELFGISAHSVNYQVNKIRKKLGFDSRDEVVEWARGVPSKENTKSPEDPSKEDTEGDGLNTPNMGDYKRFDADQAKADMKRRADIVSRAAKGALDLLRERGVLKRFGNSLTGSIKAGNQALLGRLYEAGYIGEDIAADGSVDLTGFLAWQLSKNPNTRAVLWGTAESRKIGKAALIREIRFCQQETKK